MRDGRAPERVGTVVIGGGQAGLSVGYHLARRGIPFVILEANERVGDSWRKRWDSLRLFTPARYDGLDGMPFPAPPHTFPTRIEMADYLEAYAERFALPVRTGVHVDRLVRHDDGFLLEMTGGTRIIAEQVVVAMATFQAPKLPPFAAELRPEIVQLHSSAYRRPSQLREGLVLVVGAGNSGAEIALEAARHGHPTWVSGRDPGHVPVRIDGVAARFVLPFVFRVLFHRVLTTGTPIGRRARPRALVSGGPLVRVRPRDLAAARIARVPRTAGVRDGLPVLADGRVLDAANVIWCTGFHPGFSWIDVPIFDPDGQPRHDRGIVAEAPGLYFVGLHFLYAMSSTMIHGVGRDARWVTEAIARRWAARGARGPVRAMDAGHRSSEAGDRARRVAAAS
ncbi:MAG TPA: NAD(P)-binding domain-containing protein [Gemmatimonadaceae bacterium]